MNILIIEDNPGDERLIIETLKENKLLSPNYFSARSISEGIKILQEENIDVALLDLSLPDGFGIDNVVRIKDENPDLPIIVLTGTNDEEIALQSLRQGAQDFIVKGTFDGQQIYRSLRHAIERKLSEKQLRNALAQAELANRTKTTFLTNMSHELRTPLNAIMGFSDLIQKQIFGPVTNERYLEYASHINRSGQYLLSLINDLLDLAKAESGSLSLTQKACNMKKVIDDCTHFIMRALEQNQIKLSLQIEEHIFLWADERILKQIILNLLTNAIKFSHPQSSVDLRLFIEDFYKTKLEIKDFGIGMREEDIPKALSVFGQIQQQEWHNNQVIQGSGLGLPLSKYLSELHGADFQLSSSLGRGTSVSITFPSWRTIYKKEILKHETKAI